MQDSQIVSASIADRAAYDAVAAHITAKDMTPAAGFWFGLIGEWYGRDRSAKSIDKALLIDQGDKRAPAGKNREPVIAFMRDLPEAPSPKNTAAIALELKRHAAASALAVAIASNDSKKIPLLHKQMGELMAATELKAKKGRWQDAAPIGELFSKTGADRRILLSPKALNARLNGGVMPGHHVVVFGRPDIGKSTFTINLTAALGHRGQRVLYVGNEDQIDLLKRRCVERVGGSTEQWIDGGYEDRIKFSQLIGGGVDDLAEKIEEHEATVLVLDQIRGLSSDADSMTHKLEENAIAVRELLLRYDLVGISVTQAGASAEGKAYLSMTDIDSSKTGLQGTGDVIIGIGATPEMALRGERTLSIVKNKASSAPDSKEPVSVWFDSTRSRVWS